MCIRTYLGQGGSKRRVHNGGPYTWGMTGRALSLARYAAGPCIGGRNSTASVTIRKIVITENGLSNEDWVHLDGKVHDPQRIDFTTRYLRQLRRAAEDGVDVGGYFPLDINR